jgi:shikimate kinase
VSGDKRVVLVGMMGAGKTTVGHAIAAATGWRYVDNDELVEQISGVATCDLLQQRGEAAMRTAEAAAVEKVLAMEPPLVAGAAAGVVLDDDLCARLHAGAFVVYLRASLAVLQRRVAGTDRPWLGVDPAVAMGELYQGREPRYQKLAHLVVEVDDATPADLARRIIDAIDAVAT